MNFKGPLLLLLIIASSCGVKGPPITPPGTEVPSFVSPYLDDKSVIDEKNKVITEKEEKKKSEVTK